VVLVLDARGGGAALEKLNGGHGMTEMEVDIGGFSSADLGGGHERHEEAGGEDPMRQLVRCESMNLASGRRACWRGGRWLE
jgi:hypothetical protein